MAAKAEEILGNEETINRLTAEKPSIAGRIWQTLKSFVKKITGVKSTEADRIRRAEGLFRKALEGAKGNPQQQMEGMKFALLPYSDQQVQNWAGSKQIEIYGGDPEQIRDFIRRSTENLTLRKKLYFGQIDSSLAQVIYNNTGVDTQGMNLALFSDEVVKIIRDHGSEDSEKPRGQRPITPEDFVAIPDVVGAPDEIRQSHRDRFGKPVIEFVKNSGSRQTVVTYVVNKHNDLRVQTMYVGTKKENLATPMDDQASINTPEASSGTVLPDSIPTSVENVNPETKFADPVVLPSTEVLNAQMAAFHERMANPPAPPTNDAGQQPRQPRMGERQFTTQTLQNSPAVPDWVKRELYGNDYARFYEEETNRQQLEDAWTRIQQEGYDAAVNRLTHLDHIANAVEEQELNIMMALALRPADMGGLGDFGMAMDLMLASAVQGTETGKALQARKQFAKMTPTQARRSVAERSERDLHDHMQTHRRQRELIRRQAAQVARELDGMQGGDELLRLNAAGSFTIDESNSRWGMPINEQQQALIDHYGLNNVRRPGVFYNRATTEQRMLEAILATPNPQELTGNGLTLIERLEYMQAGEAVITNADLEYIGQHLAQFASYDVDAQRGREGDLALARAYEAYGSITPASAREKARTWRYTSMLLSVPSAIRNVIGNAGQNIANATAHGIAVELDRIVSAVTGTERTMAHLSLRERIDGWHSFVQETQNTFRDFFVDRAVTQRGDDRFNTNQRGRVFQNAAAEAMRNLEGCLMSVGDRNFWRKSFVNSMAEQQRVAEMNDTALDYDAAVEQATLDANYATFNENSAVRTALTGLKQVPVVGDVLDFIMPFTGVPTNIVRRMWQFSPAGLASTIINHAWRGISGQDFNQRDFVNGMARGLTGTALFAVGMALYAAGHIKLGTGEEDDEKVYGVQTALGEQYAPYIEIFGQNISLSAFAPVTTPLIMGATAANLFEEDTDPWNALYNAALSGFDQILDASYMSNLSSIFGGHGSVAENIGSTVLESAVSQNIPSIISQIASALDPYVRDTKEKDVMLAILKTAMNKIPGVRQLLPEKVDVAGRSVVNTDYGAAAFIDPFNRTIADDDPALLELDRLYKALGTSAHLPSDALSGTKTALSGVAAPVEGEDKETYRKRYGELWRLGGSTFDKNGNEVIITGVTDLIQTKAYQEMTDAEKATAISGIISAAKAGASYEMGEKLGHTKTEAAEDTGYTKQAIRPMPARYVDMDSDDFRMLASKFEETGDGAFIPKDIGGSFTRNKVQYDLTGEEYAELQALYDIELEAQLSQIDWYVSDEELAAAVNAAYSKAASDAKDEYVKKLP